MNAESWRSTGAGTCRPGARANTVLASIFKGLNPHETEADDQPLQVKLGEQLLSVVGQLSQNSVGDALQTADLQVTLGEALYFLGLYRAAKIAVESALKTYRDTNTIATEAGMLALRDLSATFDSWASRRRLCHWPRNTWNEISKHVVRMISK